MIELTKNNIFQRPDQ